MALTVRLGPKEERLLKALAQARKVSRSDVVREAIVEYSARRSDDEAAGGLYDAWRDVLGVVDLGVRDPERTTGEQFTDIVRRTPRARRSR